MGFFSSKEGSIVKSQVLTSCLCLYNYQNCPSLQYCYSPTMPRACRQHVLSPAGGSTLDSWWVFSVWAGGWRGCQHSRNMFVQFILINKFLCKCVWKSAVSIFSNWGECKKLFQLNLYAESCLTWRLPEAKEKRAMKREILKMISELKSKSKNKARWN